MDNINVPVPKVSVLMIAYNAGPFLKQAIDSIINQSFTNFELIIVEDKSTDNSPDILSSYHDPRIKKNFNEVNLGMVATRQIALSKCKGDYVAVLDADDIAMPDRLAIQVNFLDRNKDVTLLCGSVEVINESAVNQGRISTPLDINLIKCLMLFKNPIFHSTVMFRRNEILQVDGYKGTNFVDDFNLWSKILRKGLNIASVPETLVMLRHHSKQQSFNFRKECTKEKNEIIKENISYFMKTQTPIGVDSFLMLNEIVGVDYSQLMNDINILTQINAFLMQSYNLNKHQIKILVFNQFLLLRDLIYLKSRREIKLEKKIQKFTLKSSYSIMFKVEFMKFLFHIYNPINIFKNWN